MTVYVGEMSEGMYTKKGIFTGPSRGFASVLCNDLVLDGGSGKLTYNIDRDFLKLDGAIYSYSEREILKSPSNFRNILEQFAKWDAVVSPKVEGLPLLVLFGKGSFQGDFSLERLYASSSEIAGARVSEKFVLENLAKYGRKF